VNVDASKWPAIKFPQAMHRARRGPLTFSSSALAPFTMSCISDPMLLSRVLLMAFSIKGCPHARPAAQAAQHHCSCKCKCIFIGMYHACKR
jgi:hypothetical protein